MADGVYVSKRLNKLRERLLNASKRDSEIRDRVDSAIPAALKMQLYEHDVYGIENRMDRAKIVSEIFAMRRYSANTARKYFSVLQNIGLFGEEEVQINEFAFQKIKPSQQRMPPMEAFVKTMHEVQRRVDMSVGHTDYGVVLSEKFAEVRGPERVNHHKLSSQITKAIAIRFASLTCLRVAEVMRIDADILIRLLRRENVVKLQRKCNQTEWMVFYYSAFDQLLRQMEVFFRVPIQAMAEYGVNDRLFRMTDRTIKYEIRDIYRIANQVEPPFGFGMHTIKYVVATNLASNGELEAARLLMNHKSIATTKRYVRFDKLRNERVFKALSSMDGGYFKELNDIFM